MIERDEASVMRELSTYTYASDVHPDKWTNRERIQFLLDRWDDIFAPNMASSLSGLTGGGSGLEPRLPVMAHHRSVRELDRCLGVLVERAPTLYRHLKAYRCNAEWRQVKAKIKFRGPNGREVGGDGWKKERIVPSWISLKSVRLAEDLLVAVFRGDVFIPDDLWNGLTKPVTGQ